MTELQYIFDKELTCAKDYFHAQTLYQKMEADMDDWLWKNFDLIVEHENGCTEYFCEDMTYDYYDHSFELKGVVEGYKPTEEQLKNAAEFGFDRCWICYKDGSEKYYYLAKYDD